MIFLRLFWILSILFLSNVREVDSKKNLAGRIIGGQTAHAGQFPSVAAIHVSTANSRFFCGGALIDSEWILTAGQCVNGASSFTILLGSTTLEATDETSVTLVTSEYILHPDFNPSTLEHDIGLIKLRMGVTYSDYIKKIFMAYGNLSDYTDLVAVGWGQISDSSSSLSNTLNFVDLAVVSNTACKAIYGNQISDHMVCVAGIYDEGICTGDSGSPLIHFDSTSSTGRHVGIASFISGNGCESTDPSGYTRTYSYKEWITNITGIIS